MNDIHIELLHISTISLTFKALQPIDLGLWDNGHAIKGINK